MSCMKISLSCDNFIKDVNIAKTLEAMKTERECIARQQCDRDCSRCDLVMDTQELLDAFDAVISILLPMTIIRESEEVDDVKTKS